MYMCTCCIYLGNLAVIISVPDAIVVGVCSVMAAAVT